MRTGLKIIPVFILIALVIGLCPGFTFADDEGMHANLRSATSLLASVVGEVHAEASQGMDELNVQALETLSVEGVNVVQVSLAGHYSAAVGDDGSLWVWGQNPFYSWDYKSDSSELSKLVTLNPTKIMDGVSKVCVGQYCAEALKDDGSLWLLWRSNVYDWTDEHPTNPVRVPERMMDEVTDVAFGYDHHAALRSDGSLWMWGYNDCGQLGDGTTSNRIAHVKVMDNVNRISLGYRVSAAVKTDGSLWIWGNDVNGIYELDAEDYELEGRVLTPLKMLENIDRVAFAREGMCVLDNNGTLSGWGYGDWRQRWELSNTAEGFSHEIIGDVVDFSFGHRHSLAITRDGTLWAWGDNDYGQLGDGTTVRSSYPRRIMGDVAKARVGYDFSTAVKSDGSLWTWGSNEHGQLGIGTNISCDTPNHVLDDVSDSVVYTGLGGGSPQMGALLNDGSLWMWGYNGSSNLGKR